MMSLPLREAREMFEREYLLAQVSRFGGNISRTAEFHRHGALGAAPQAQIPGPVRGSRLGMAEPAAGIELQADA